MSASANSGDCVETRPHSGDPGFDIERGAERIMQTTIEGEPNSIPAPEALAGLGSGEFQQVEASTGSRSLAEIQTNRCGIETHGTSCTEDDSG